MREIIPDYYTLLGVSKNASDQDIKRAYRKKAKEYHPDVSKRCDATEMFSLVAKAYSILKNREKRQAYNHELMADIFQEQVVNPARRRFSEFGYTNTVSEDAWGWRVG